MNLYKYPLFWLMLVLCCVSGYRGSIFSPYEWNVSTFIAIILIIFTVLFVVMFDVEINPFKIREHERRLKEIWYRDRLNDIRPNTDGIITRNEPLVNHHFNESVRKTNQLVSEITLENSNTFEYSLSDADTISRLVNYIKSQPRKAFDRQNVILGYGVVDKERTIFVTLIYFLSESIKRSGDDVDDYEYAVVTKDEIFSASFHRWFRTDVIKLDLGNHEEYRSIVSHAIHFREIVNSHDWEKKLKEDNPNFSLYQYNSELNRKYL